MSSKYNSSSSSSSGGGCGCIGIGLIITLTLVTLKMTGVISWDWLTVSYPLLIGIGVTLLCAVLAVIMLVVGYSMFGKD